MIQCVIKHTQMIAVRTYVCANRELCFIYYHYYFCFLSVSEIRRITCVFQHTNELSKSMIPVRIFRILALKYFDLFNLFVFVNLCVNE